MGMVKHSNKAISRLSFFLGHNKILIYFSSDNLANIVSDKRTNKLKCSIFRTNAFNYKSSYNVTYRITKRKYADPFQM